MKKVLDYFLGGIYLIYFGLTLVIFHIIQVVAFNLFGAQAHQKTVNWFSYALIKGTILTGSTVSFNQMQKIPPRRTIIFVANHQSMFDIPGMIWFLRKHTPKFISKKELGRGIPGISYNLRVGQAALIDRNDPKQAIMEISRFSQHIKENMFSAVIFPEGTRSRNGHLKPFAIGGLATLLKKCPSALVVPVAITNTGKFNPKGMYPFTGFTKMSWNTLKVINPRGFDPDEITHICYENILSFLIQNKAWGYDSN